jgi:hypothetical protein
MYPLVLAVVFLIAACSTPVPRFETIRREKRMLSGSEFEISVAKDTYGSKWRLAEVRPTSMPYSGEIVKLTAEDRWRQMFENLNEIIHAECKSGPASKPIYRSELRDFTKVGTSTTHPQYLQARFICK